MITDQSQYETEEGLNPGLLYALVKTRRLEIERDIGRTLRSAEYDNAEVLEHHLYKLIEQEEVLKQMMEGDSEVL